MKRLAFLATSLLFLSMGTVAQAEPNPAPADPTDNTSLVEARPTPTAELDPTPGPEPDPTEATSQPTASLERTEPSPTATSPEPSQEQEPSHPTDEGSDMAPDDEPMAETPSADESAGAPSTGHLSSSESCTVTLATAGTKPVGEDSNLWGWARNCPAAITITAQHLVDGEWADFTTGPVADTGYFVIPAPNSDIAGLQTYRVGFNGQWSETVTLERVPTIKAFSAGTKPVGLDTYTWGSATGAPNRPVFTEALVGGRWSRSQTATTDSNGRYTIELTYGKNSVGTYRYRVGVDTVAGRHYSAPFTLERTSQITAFSAGTKPVGLDTYTWGSAAGAPNRPVFTEVLVDGRWLRSQVGTTDSRGGYTLKLTYGWNTAGTYRFRVGVDTANGRHYSPPFSLSRTAAWSASIRNTVAADVQHSYRAGCPVGPSGLSTITMTYRNYTGSLSTGVLVVRRDIATTTRDAFREAFDGGFRIAQMTNPDNWQADDVAMMAVNNTSAFNCRHVVGNPYRMSPHSYGRAVDINPAQNPYRAPDGRWYPNATFATNRPTSVTGLLHANSPMVKAMTRRGFEWFSGWDWHHFER